MNLGANKYKTNKIVIWTKLWIIICFHIRPFIIDSFLFVGSLFNSSSYGGSVANARDPNESIIKFTHNIWIGVNGVSLPMHAQIKTIKHAQKFTVNWNCKNFLILS